MRCAIFSLLFVASATLTLAGSVGNTSGHGHIARRGSVKHARRSGSDGGISRRASAATARAKRHPQAGALLGSLGNVGNVANLANVGNVGNLANVANLGNLASTGGAMNTVGSLAKTATGATDLEAIHSLLAGVTGSSSGSSKKMRSYAAKAKSSKSSRSNSAFQDSVYQELKAYRSQYNDLLGLSPLVTALQPLYANQGLKNFNRNDPVQVLLRTTVSSLTETMEAVDLIIFYIPVLGPILGPIVYDLKCIIDDILALGEETVDGLLNQLYPELKGLSGGLLSVACKGGPSLPFC